MIGTSINTGSEFQLNRRLLVAVLVVLRAAVGVCQSTPTVSPVDPVYGFIDRLVAVGALDTVILGQRPMSQREVLRVLRASRPAVAGNTNLALLRASLDRYESYYSEPVSDSARRPRLDAAG